MLTPRILVRGVVSVAVFAIGLCLEPNVSQWSEGTGFLASARGQMPLEGCNPAPIPQSMDGSEYFHCDNGKYYRRLHGQYVEVDHRGTVLPQSEAQASEPAGESATAAPPSEAPAEPEFKKAPE